MIRQLMIDKGSNCVMKIVSSEHCVPFVKVRLAKKRREGVIGSRERKLKHCLSNVLVGQCLYCPRCVINSFNCGASVS